jgi:pimeloyl-ACP methyl ester carboxylesterase
LHGWGANIELVWPLAESLAKQGFKVFSLDLPGFGNSAPPPTAWTVHDYAALVIAFMDVQGLDRVCLFGHSFGGRISILLGARYAERFSKIVLCDAAGVKPPTPLRRVILGKLYDTAARWIKPGNPQQNGRHERMHLTLKLETTKPAGANFLQQQAKFDDFINEFNTERPHQAP